MSETDFAEGLGAPGARLWESVTGPYELAVHEQVILREACRAVDVLDQLDALVSTEGIMVDNPNGGQRVHPAMVESRLQRQNLARLVAHLRLPEDASGTGKRPQRRSGARPYGITGPVA